MIVDYVKILSILQKLDTEYQANVGGIDFEKPVAISKIAVIEFCGWIEESIDLILLDYLNNRISDSECINYIKGIIKYNYGFGYEKNLFHLFTVVLGINNWENILDVLTISNISILKSVCTNYTNIRNVAAHTYRLTGITVTYQSPSQIIADFNKIKPIFQTIETEISKLK